MVCPTFKKRFHFIDQIKIKEVNPDLVPFCFVFMSSWDEVRHTQIRTHQNLEVKSPFLYICPSIKKIQWERALASSQNRSPEIVLIKKSTRFCKEINKITTIFRILHFQ